MFKKVFYLNYYSNMENLQTWSKTPKNCEWWSKDKILATLGGESTDNENSRQRRIDAVFDKALAAKDAWDMEAYNDYMNQIKNLEDLWLIR